MSTTVRDDTTESVRIEGDVLDRMRALAKLTDRTLKAEVGRACLAWLAVHDDNGHPISAAPTSRPKAGPRTRP